MGSVTTAHLGLGPCTVPSNLAGQIRVEDHRECHLHTLGPYSKLLGISLEVVRQPTVLRMVHYHSHVFEDTGSSSFHLPCFHRVALHSCGLLHAWQWHIRPASFLYKKLGSDFPSSCMQSVHDRSRHQFSQLSASSPGFFYVPSIS